MATRAYILIETAVGKTKDVLSAVKQVRGVTVVDAVTGHYDVIAVLEADDLNSIGRIVTSQLQGVGGVLRTTTCLAITF